MVVTALRISRLTLHLGFGLCAALVFSRLSPRTKNAVMRWWACGLLTALGVRLRAAGDSPRQSGLMVANHISWLDVVAIAAAQPVVFVCKSEIADWPCIGWMLRRVGTIFLHRGSFRDVRRVNLQTQARLAAMQDVAVFPEGTTTEGRHVLPFRPALFQPAVERGLPVYPVAIAYSSNDAAYVGETTFLQSLLAVARARRLEVHLEFLPPLWTYGLKRRQAADQSRSLILARTRQIRIFSSCFRNRRAFAPSRNAQGSPGW